MIAVSCSTADLGTAEPASAPTPISSPISVALQQKNEKLLTSAASALAAGDAAGALQLYREIDPAALPDARRLDYFVNRADAALQEGELLLAREILSLPELQARHQQLSADARRRWLGLRGELFGLLGETAASVAAYIELTDLLTDREERREIERAIWQVLERTPTNMLTKLAAEPASARVHGWYQLALASREQAGGTGADPAVASPAPGGPVPGVEAIRAPATAPALARVALLLPRTGNYSVVGNVIRDGFFAANFAAQAGGTAAPDIKMYDTASGDILEIYQRAVADGAQLVIGPLEQPFLARLAAEPALPVPVLGLNYLEDESAPVAANFHTLGLSVAEEAEAVARRAWQDGRRSALALAPDTSWGRRALDAFRNTFTALGGELRTGTIYDMALKDFAPVLRPLLAVETAAPPGGDGEPPRRRTDIDMVFLVAYPTQGRQIKPTLDFLYAGDLPVYATSAIYTGVADPARDGDLGDIQFSAMAWSLADTATLAPAPDANLTPAYRPFFALGNDAYLLHAWLGGPRPGADIVVAGHTGTLVFDGSPRIRRIQPWARFRNGRVYPESAGQ